MINNKLSIKLDRIDSATARIRTKLDMKDSIIEDVATRVEQLDLKEYKFGTKNVIANGTFVATDDNLDGFSSIVVNVPSGGTGSSGVYLYKTVDEMNASTGHLDTDIAIVLDSAEVPITSGMEISSIILPKTISFSEPITDVWIDAMLRNDNTPIDGRIMIDSNVIDFNVYLMDEGTQIMANYTTEDGQTFTLDYYDGFDYTDGTILLPAGTFVDLWEYEDVFGEAFKTKGGSLGGIFDLITGSWKPTNVGINLKPEELLTGARAYGDSGIVQGCLGTINSNEDFINVQNLIRTGLSTYKPTDISTIFRDKEDIVGWDLLDTSEVTNSALAFMGNTVSGRLDASNRDFSKNTNMYGTFMNMPNVTEIDVTGLKMNTTGDVRTDSLFAGCPKLERIRGLETLDLSKIRNLSGWVLWSQIDEIDIQTTPGIVQLGYLLCGNGTPDDENPTAHWPRRIKFRCPNLKQIYYAFNASNENSDIEEIDLSECYYDPTLTEVSSSERFLCNMKGLKKVDVRNLDFTLVKSYYRFIDNCNMDFLCIVKDEANKEIFESHGCTNVVTAAEYEGGTE